MNSRRTTLAGPPASAEAGPQARFALGAYRLLWSALSPAVRAALAARASRGKEDRERLHERLGQATRPRPPGRLIWIHGASVGECLAALPLTGRLLQSGDSQVLVTSGTVTSAQLMTERLPPGAFHQYVPIDSRDAVRRFLAHWRPDLALFIESELWPNLVLETHTAGVPMALVNARMSERSFRGWLRAPGIARRLLSAFDACLAQDDKVAARLQALGAHDVQITGSLKADAEPLPVVEQDLSAFRQSLQGRPLLLAASTHPGEEEIIFEAAELLRVEGWPGITVIVPRHPHRGTAIAELAAARRLQTRRRAANELPESDTAVYVADTLGELGLFYRAAPFAFLGGSLIGHGGQNPLEPARLGTAVVTGPHTENFADTFRTLLTAQGEGLVHSAEELRGLARHLFGSPGHTAALGAKARLAAESMSGALARTVTIAEQLLAAPHARA
jgi:3-deoxy-D-manno-octulosonic-acid transferase